MLTNWPVISSELWGLTPSYFLYVTMTSHIREGVNSEYWWRNNFQQVTGTQEPVFGHFAFRVLLELLSRCANWRITHRPRKLTATVTRSVVTRYKGKRPSLHRHLRYGTAHIHYDNDLRGHLKAKETSNGKKGPKKLPASEEGATPCRGPVPEGAHLCKGPFQRSILSPNATFLHFHFNPNS